MDVTTDMTRIIEAFIGQYESFAADANREGETNQAVYYLAKLDTLRELLLVANGSADAHIIGDKTKTVIIRPF